MIITLNHTVEENVIISPRRNLFAICADFGEFCGFKHCKVYLSENTASLLVTEHIIKLAKVLNKIAGEAGDV